MLAVLVCSLLVSLECFILLIARILIFLCSIQKALGFVCCSVVIDFFIMASIVIFSAFSYSSMNLVYTLSSATYYDSLIRSILCLFLSLIFLPACSLISFTYNIYSALQFRIRTELFPLFFVPCYIFYSFDTV